MATVDQISEEIKAYLQASGNEFQAAVRQGVVDYAYTGFDPCIMAVKLWPKIKPKKKEFAKFISLIATRGTILSKIEDKIKDDKKQEVNNYSSDFDVEWEVKSLKSDTVTPQRLLLCFPELTVFAMQEIKNSITCEFPWPWRHPALASIIPRSYFQGVMALMYSSYIVTRTVDKDKHNIKQCLENAVKYTCIALGSKILQPAKRASWWDKHLKPFWSEIDDLSDRFLGLCKKYYVDPVKAYEDMIEKLNPGPEETLLIAKGEGELDKNGVPTDLPISYCYSKSAMKDAEYEKDSENIVKRLIVEEEKDN